MISSQGGADWEPFPAKRRHPDSEEAGAGIPGHATILRIGPLGTAGAGRLGLPHSMNFVQQTQGYARDRFVPWLW